MLKQFLNSGSLKSLMLFDAESEQGAAEEKAKLREQLSKGNTVKDAIVVPPIEEEVIEEDDEENEDDPKLDADGNPIVEETAEEKTAREAKEAEEGKAKRKEDRIQKRIDKAYAAQKIAENEVLELKKQLAANPDKTLTEEEIQRRAEAIAAEKVATKEIENLQKEFTKNCDVIQEASIKLDKEFTPKVQALAAEIGPLPTPMMNVLFDLENGADVLVYLVNDVDEAERIYDLQSKPAKLGIALSKISDKLIAAKKPKEKEISKAPEPMTPVNGNRIQSSQITEKDTKPEGMENFVRKRQLQMEARRKQGR